MKFLGQEINRQDMGQISNAQMNPTHYEDMLQDVLNRNIQTQQINGIQPEGNPNEHMGQPTQGGMNPGS